MLIYFVIIPVLTLAGLALTKNKGIDAIRAVAVTGATALVGLALYLVFYFLRQRHLGVTDDMILTTSVTWYAPLNIKLALGVDGVSVVMILLSAFIVFAGVFASWKMDPLPKQFFLWFFLLSTGVFGFFISVDLFTMFMFYEVALIPMYLLIGVWGSGNKNYSAMKLTLMLMGGSAFLMLGIIGIYFHSTATPGEYTMNLLEIAKNNAIPHDWQMFLFPMTFVGFGVLGAMFPFHTWSPDGHGRLWLLPHCHLSHAFCRTAAGMDFLDIDRHQHRLWCFQRMCADRPQVHQCLFVGKPLRYGTLRHLDV